VTDDPTALGLGDPTAVPHVHVVGIGGAGMSAIATVLLAMGHEVTGSDLRESGVTERLRSLGIVVAIGHDAANVGDADLVTLSTAVQADNPEVVEARERGIPVVARAETLAAITARKRCIAVAGTHGKTTTASMLSLILVEAGLRPSFLIGGEVNEIGTNAVWDTGEWIVVEADESDGTFLHLVPDIAIVTNVEADHLDHYGSFDAVRTAFAEFLASAGHRVVGGDDAEALVIGRAAELQPLREATVPVKGSALVIGGEHDAVFPPDLLLFTAQRWKAKTVVIPRAGHTIMLDAHWESAADRIASWLEQHLG